MMQYFTKKNLGYPVGVHRLEFIRPYPIVLSDLLLWNMIFNIHNCFNCLIWTTPFFMLYVIFQHHFLKISVTSAMTFPGAKKK